MVYTPKLWLFFIEKLRIHRWSWIFPQHFRTEMTGQGFGCALRALGHRKRQHLGNKAWFNLLIGASGQKLSGLTSWLIIIRLIWINMD